jgi:hypothetical protein
MRHPPFFETMSTVTGGAAATLNSIVSGNLTPAGKFSLSQLANIAAAAAASRIPIIKPWAKTLGDLAEEGFDLSNKAKEACR